MKYPQCGDILQAVSQTYKQKPTNEKEAEEEEALFCEISSFGRQRACERLTIDGCGVELFSVLSVFRTENKNNFHFKNIGLVTSNEFILSTGSTKFHQVSWKQEFKLIELDELTIIDCN